MNSTLDEKLLAQAASAARQMPLGVCGNIAAALVSVSMLWPFFCWLQLLPMVLGMALLQIRPVILVVLRRHRFDQEPRYARALLRNVLVDSVILGLYWATAILLYLPHVDPGVQRVLLVAAFFLTAGGASVLQSVPASFFAYTVPIILAGLHGGWRVMSEDGGQLLLLLVMMGCGVNWMMWINWHNFRELVHRNNKLDALRREAEAARRAEMVFVENLNHEIRNAVSGVVGYFDIALESHLSDAEHQTLIGNARDASGLLLTLLSDLLDVARLNAGRTPLSVQTFDFREMVRLSIVSTSAGIRRRPISVVTDIDERVPQRLSGDAARIRQILVNLVGNSIKVMSKGTVVVKADYRHHDGRDWLELAVIDDGPGIAPEQKKILFERFSRLSDLRGSGTGHGITGWGLGLSISASLVGLMDGAISVESEEGKGASFHISLPLPAVHETERTASLERAANPHVRSKFSILIVDDMPMNLLVLGKMLESLGCRVTTAESGAQAVARCAESSFDLVMMDVDMVDMDGIEATQRIRGSAGAMANVPIVAVTGFASPEQVARILASGMNDHALKPIRKSTVERLLARWVRIDSSEHRPATAAA